MSRKQRKWCLDGGQSYILEARLANITGLVWCNDTNLKAFLGHISTCLRQLHARWQKDTIPGEIWPRQNTTKTRVEVELSSSAAADPLTTQALQAS